MYFTLIDIGHNSTEGFYFIILASEKFCLIDFSTNFKNGWYLNLFGLTLINKF